jgi:hypothetical protein
MIGKQQGKQKHIAIQKAQYYRAIQKPWSGHNCSTFSTLPQGKIFLCIRHNINFFNERIYSVLLTTVQRNSITTQFICVIKIIFNFFNQLIFFPIPIFTILKVWVSEGNRTPVNLNHNQAEKPTFPTDTVVQEGIEPPSSVNQTEMLTITPPYSLLISDVR